MALKECSLMLIGLLVVLGGCTMAPTYSRPDAPVPTAWPTGEAYSDAKTIQSEPAAADLKWQEFFSDERLRTIIETALKNNRDLRLAALNVQKARGMYGIQRAELFPAINATGSGTGQRVPGSISQTGQPQTTHQYEATVGISAWEIDFFGRLQSLKDAALEEYLATEQARRSVQISLISTIAETFLTLAADREALKLSQSTLETQQASYDLIKQRYDIGVASALDLHRSQTQVDTAKVNVARYTQLVAQDENALNLLVGTSTAVPRELLPADLSDVKPPREISAAIPSEVLLKRPDIMAQEHRLKAANANIGAARSAFFPSISLTTFLGTASNELSNLFGAGSKTWLFSPQIALPILDARLWSRLDVAKAEKEIAIAEYEKAIQVAFREVADALAVYGTVSQQLAAQQSLVAASEKTYGLTNMRYTTGVDGYLSVLDAQRSLFAAQQDLISVRLTKLANQSRLYAVLGGGADE